MFDSKKSESITRFFKAFKSIFDTEKKNLVRMMLLNIFYNK